MQNIVKMTTVALFLAGSVSLMAGAAVARDHNSASESHHSGDRNHAERHDASGAAEHSNHSTKAAGSHDHLCQLPSATDGECLATGTDETEGVEAGEASETDLSVDGTESSGI